MESNYSDEVQDLYALFLYSQELMNKMLGKRETLHSKWYIGQAAFCFIACFESVGVALTFLPDSPLESEFEAPAFTSLASSARLIHEGLYITTYLLADKSEEESELQRLAWEYHTEKKRLIIVEAFSPEHPDLDVLRNHVAELKEAFEAHELFEGLDNNKKSNVLQGRTDRTMYRSEIEDLLNIDTSYLSSGFIFLSQYSHLTSYAANQVNAYGLQPDSIPAGLSILVRDILCKYSMIVSRLAKAFGVEVPENARQLIDHYVGVIEALEVNFAALDEDDVNMGYNNAL